MSEGTVNTMPCAVAAAVNKLPSAKCTSPGAATTLDATAPDVTALNDEEAEPVEVLASGFAGRELCKFMPLIGHTVHVKLKSRGW